MTLGGTMFSDTINGGFDATKAPVTQARHLPGYIYSSPEVYRRANENFFMKDWLCVGRVEEVENPGDYITFRAIDEPGIVARDDLGNLNAFSNVCRHRGVEVASGAGNLKEFSCPYHGWTYDLAGMLLGAPYMREATGFDPASCRLNPLRSGVWEGNVFVTFNPEPQPLEVFVHDFDKVFGFLKQAQCRLHRKQVVDFDCNWQLFVENASDVYHLEVLHANSIGAHIGGENFSFGLLERGGFSSFHDAAPGTPSGKSLFGKMPWMRDKPESFECAGYMGPNFLLFARVDEVHPMIVWPLEPTKTRVVVYHLYPKDCFTRPDFEETAKLYQDFVGKVLDEDRQLLGSLQDNLNSRSFRPGRFSKLERNVHHGINHFLDRMFSEQ